MTGKPQTTAELKNMLQGALYTEAMYTTLYATDASAYREHPVAVAIPQNEADIQLLLNYSQATQTPLIPRAGGTSLAGQVVGNGLVVDFSKHFNQILEIDEKRQQARVQPGVVLDQLNKALKPHHLFFAPETSTSNRCCIGGMIGNNSCGSHSLVYGSTREHLLEANCLLSNGEQVTFKRLTTAEAKDKATQTTLEGQIYKTIIGIIEQPGHAELIQENFPDKRLTRRNSGYAIDILQEEWQTQGSINLCKLLCGSEGTLAIVTEATLHLEPLPPAHTAVMCMHCNTLEEAFHANLVALRHKPVAIELMDSNILERSKHNLSQAKNRFFLKGDPAAILIIEMAETSREQLEAKADHIEADMKAANYGFHYPRIFGADIQKVWALRKAGLGLLSTIPGDAKPVSLIEDTAVIPEYLPAYMKDMDSLLKSFGLSCVHHAHIATGELHLRPILNLKDPDDLVKFRKISYETTLLVKKYKGSISGEHGDGRLRGEFIPLLYGQEIYRLFQDIKKQFDPENRLNPGKITATKPMDAHLRYEAKDLKVNTYFDFSAEKGWLSAVEQCNGAADCRKSSLFGGLMCPSYQATNDERFSTRARANLMREYLIHPKHKKFSQPEVLQVLEECLSCKGCKTECPSNVDMAKLKAEYLQHHYDEAGIPLKVRLIGNLSKLEKLGSLVPGLYNSLLINRFTSKAIKNMMGFAPERSLPTIGKESFRTWCNNNLKALNKQLETKKLETKKPETKQYETTNPAEANSSEKPVIQLFIDEFTNHHDVEIGIQFVLLMNHLGYRIETPKHVESGRTEISTGMLKKARNIAEKNVALLHPIANKEQPLVGLEPSTLLTFRDEYPSLLRGEAKTKALELAKNSLMYDEFIQQEIQAGRIQKEQFTQAECEIHLHGHCHQKSLASIEPSRIILSLPVNYKVHVIPSGCCGMAGSYGYKKQQYQLSMAIGEQILFPAIRKATSGHTTEVLISAPGTSCRQQILDGTGVVAQHPIEILYESIR